MTIESYFSHKDDIQSIISTELDKAQENIFVAVAWFTDTFLFSKLIEKQREGVHVELIITNHEINSRSRNHYDLINQNGGLFVEVGNDYQTMHNKFCIIDYKVLINGSYNWTKKASQSNRENILVFKNDTLQVNQFVDEFESMKKLAGLASPKASSFELPKTINYFNLFKAFITIGDTAQINSYLHEIKDISELKHITDSLFNGEYQDALKKMDLFISEHAQIINISEIEKTLLVSQIKLLTNQIEILLAEKGGLETKINQFNHRYIIELNPLILKILSLKKKVYEKLEKYGIVNNTFKNAEEEFKKANEEYIKEQKIDIPDLDIKDSEDLKTMYREAVKLCHPDSPNCIFDDKMKAAEAFDALTKANKHNNINQVKTLLNELKLGKTDKLPTAYNEIIHLKAKLATLKAKYDRITTELGDIKDTEVYGILNQFGDWNDYFELQKSLLQQEIQTLNRKYTNNEQRTTTTNESNY